MRSGSLRLHDEHDLRLLGRRRAAPSYSASFLPVYDADDHSFLTKAQEYWMELIDLKRYSEAEEFLFSLRWSLPNQQDEIREMVHDAYQIIFSEKAG